MSSIKKLDAIPVLDQSDFLPLPSLGRNSILRIFDSPWQNSEKEWAAGIIVTACARKGKWYVIPIQTFMSILNQKPRLQSHAGDITNNLWILSQQGYLHMIKVNIDIFIVPTPQFANTALATTNILKAI